MFKVEETNVVDMKDLQSFCRIHFGTDQFMIFNKDGLTDIEFDIPANFQFSNYNERTKHMTMIKRIHKIFEADSVDLRNSHVVVYYLVMLGVLKVSGHCRVTGTRYNEYV